MGRINKSTEGVFLNIVGNESVRPSYNVFLYQESTEADQDDRYCLADLISEYSMKCMKHKVDFEQLSQLEILIMQIRTRYKFKDTVKLYYVNKKSGISYIYARCPFYRTWSDTNEVRVLIDKAEHYTESRSDHALSILSGNPEFMQKVYDEITEVMDGEINETLRSYKKIYQK
jgi:hypothetical protein